MSNARSQTLNAKKKDEIYSLSSNARINYACRPIMTGFRNFVGCNVECSFAKCQLFSLIYAFNWQGEKMDASKSFTLTATISVHLSVLWVLFSAD